jgi:hypothetical protein
MQGVALYWLGGRPSCLDRERAKICSELWCIKAQNGKHSYENWLWTGQCSLRTELRADQEEAAFAKHPKKTL